MNPLIPPSRQGQKFDQGKLDWALLPIEPTEDIIRVLMHGAKLYGRENWKEVENGKQRYWNAAMRHLTEHRKGVLLDPETGLSHLSHAGCNILFLLYLELGDGQETTQEERSEPVQPAVGA